MKRLVGLLLILALAALAGCGATATATNGGTEPILTYPSAPATPTMGQPPAQAAPALVSVSSLPLSPTDLLAGWQVVDTPSAFPGEGGMWVEREGHLAQNGVKPAGSVSASETALMSPDAYGDVTVSASFYDTGNGTVGLIARHSNSGYYRVRLLTDPSYDGEALVLEKVIGGAAAPLVMNAGEPLYERHSWHTLELSVRGTQLVAKLDGTVVAQVEDAAPLPAGQVGLYTRAFGRISFDQVAVTEEGR